MKIIISLLLILFCLNVNAQKKVLLDTIYYYKGIKQVDKSDEWNSKLHLQSSKDKSITTLNETAYNSDRQITRTKITKIDSTRSSAQIISEKYYLEADCKTVSTVFMEGKDSVNASEKCLSLDGKVLSADKPCLLRSGAFDERKLQLWVADRGSELARDIEGKVIYYVTFKVSPDRSVSMISVTTNEGSSRYPSIAKKLAAIISSIPKELLSQQLDTINGKEISKTIRMPIMLVKND